MDVTDLSAGIFNLFHKTMYITTTVHRDVNFVSTNLSLYTAQYLPFDNSKTCMIILDSNYHVEMDIKT